MCTSDFHVPNAHLKEHVGGVGVCVTGGWLVCVYAEITELCLFLSDSVRDMQCRRKQRGEGMDWRGDGCSNTHAYVHTESYTHSWCSEPMPKWRHQTLTKQTIKSYWNLNQISLLCFLQCNLYIHLIYILIHSWDYYMCTFTFLNSPACESVKATTCQYKHGLMWVWMSANLLSKQQIHVKNGLMVTA